MGEINPTISQGLGRYSIGEKLRTLRLRKDLGLVELGKHTGLSPGLLSKLERGKLVPTLPTLLRIAMVYGVGLDHFFTDERKRRVVSVVKREERVRSVLAELLPGRLDARRAAGGARLPAPVARLPPPHEPRPDRGV